MENNFENLHILLAGLKNSGLPEERLFYLKCLRKLFAIGERLNKLNPNEELQKSLAIIKKQGKNYQLYPKLNNVL